MNWEFPQGNLRNMHRDNWDDLRYVLAVAETGSVSGAARGLGVNHSTVLRHVASFEARHGVELFEKSARGYAIIPENLRLIEAAREVEVAVQAIGRMIEGAQAPLTGVVRVTSTDTFCTRVLPQAMARMQARAGDLTLEILSTNAHLDLARLHADVTVRPADKLPDDLTGTIAAELAFGHYRRRGASEPGPWLGLSGALARSRPAVWMAGALSGDAPRGGADSFLTLAEMVAAGLGQAILPCILGGEDPRLERCRGVVPDLAVPVWVASHSDLRDVPRLRAARALLVEAIAEDAGRLAGASG